MPVSVFTHGVLLGALIVVPLVATGTLPNPRTALSYGVPAPVVAYTPPEVALIDTTPPALPEIDVNIDAAPLEAPEGVKPEPPPRLPSTVGVVPVAPAFESMTMIVAPRPAPKTPVPVGGDIRRPERIRYVAPAYPAIAKAARVAGMVIVEATIATDGSVRNARVTRSIPMLDQAALDAVSQWRYTPTMLNAQPVEVIMSVNLTFEIK